MCRIAPPYFSKLTPVEIHTKHSLYNCFANLAAKVDCDDETSELVKAKLQSLVNVMCTIDEYTWMCSCCEVSVTSAQSPFRVTCKQTPRLSPIEPLT